MLRLWTKNQRGIASQAIGYSPRMHFLPFLLAAALWTNVFGSSRDEFCYYSIKNGGQNSNKPCQSKVDHIWGKLNPKLRNPSGCRRTLTASRSTNAIQSHPYFDSRDYPNNRSCKWKIKHSGRNLYLSFKTFQLQDSPKCAKDYVVIQNFTRHHSAEKETHRYCGRKGPPKTMYSSGTTVIVQFHSDGSIRERGFFAEYSSDNPL